MPKINANGPTYFGAEGLAVDANQQQYQLDPTATQEDIEAGKDHRGDVRVKDDARSVEDVKADGQQPVNEQEPHGENAQPVDEPVDEGKLTPADVAAPKAKTSDRGTSTAKSKP